ESFPNAKIYIMQGISAYVGSDLVAGIIRINLENEKGNALLVDLGTNGEIILKSDSGMLAASTAAGPAFEGGHISNGMIAKRGAIDHVW
ncbi:ASKHA domain-containing protein, partial [Klebsiella variicola]|uniref:ASKHA domain-containing protein n=1 Tax=Klebsiella variicola TaxID=244366 RepID=UPI0027316DE2